jgi:carbamoyltransferase
LRSSNLPTPRVLGLSGGSAPPHAMTGSLSRSRLRFRSNSLHDAAAVLVCGGSIVAAVEEERLNRLKHSNCIPLNAIRACLRIARLGIGDIDRVAYYGREDYWDTLFADYLLRYPDIPPTSKIREYFGHLLSQNLAHDVAPKLRFVEHHLAHAISVYMPGPFADALVVTLDGEGDGFSGTVWAGEQGRLHRLLDIPAAHSLGLLYLRVIRFLA